MFVILITLQFPIQTTPDEFRKNILSVVDSIDQSIPSNSHVIFYGQEYGLEIWDTVARRKHPTLDMTYAPIWEFMDCILANPCTGWLTSNKTIRIYTQNLANQLNAVFDDIASNPPKQFQNFDLYSAPQPTSEISFQWISAGHDPLDLREKHAGAAHPSTTVQMLIAQKLLQDPEILKRLGPVNPHRDKILSLNT